MSRATISARRWTLAGVWAVADRGFFSLSNFLVSLLLARWLTEAAYGSFAMALAMFLLAGALHAGWITEPLIVFGSSRYRDRFPAYLGFLLRRHAVFSLWTTAAVLLVAGGAAAVGHRQVAVALAAAGLATPWILLQWLGRLACYASVGPRRAAIAGGVQLALVLAGLVALQELGLLSTAAAFALLGVTGGLTGLALVASLRPTIEGGEFDTETRGLHRRYGGWATASGVLTWIPGQVYYLVLPAAGALAAGGNLRALMNLVLPLMQAFVAISTVLTTGLARTRYTKEFGRTLRLALQIIGGAAVLYALFLTWAGPAVLSWLYSGRYDHLAPLLPLVSWLPLIGVGATVLAPALRALERPDQVFAAYSASTVLSLSVGLFLTIRYGVAGAATALLITTAVTTGVLAWRSWVALRGGPTPHGAGSRSDGTNTGSLAGTTTSNSPSENTT